MSEKQQIRPLVCAKLHRPTVALEFVCRERLRELLDTAFARPLTLISAPAGYGKSSLLAHWIESREEPGAWFSLDENDGDLTGFLNYFLAAVRELFPGALRETESLLMGSDPSPALLASALANELDALDSPFALVLDDYHHLETSSEVHELLRRLLQHPPRPLHLIIISRIDPPLPLASLRARTCLTEVRLEDLRFSASETLALLANTGTGPVSDGALTNLASQLEGWAVGLHLTILALRHAKDPDGFLKSLHGGVAAVQDYLVQEVLTGQSEPMRDWMLRSSVLDRFCPALCDAVCRPQDTVSPTALDGKVFTDALRELNLFCISLDSRHEWLRYHHQFQALLQNELARRIGAEEIADLHSRASAWFAANGRIEEAIGHALAAGDPEGAARLVEEHRMAALMADQWYVLERWLSLLPAGVAKRRPALLLARAWILESRLSLAPLPALLDEVEALLGSGPEDETLSSEVDYFRGFFLFYEGKSALCLEHMERASRNIPAAYHRIHAEADLYLPLGRQMAGREESARRVLEDRLADLDTLPPIRQTRVLGSLAFLHVISNDLTSAASVSGLLEHVANEVESFNALAWSHYLRGLVHFHRRELDEAESCFARAIEGRHSLHRRAVADALVGLTLCRELLGRSDEADAAQEQLFEYSRVHSYAGSLFVAEACGERLALLRGGPASCPARGAESPPTEVMLFWLEIPAITHCRCLLALGSTESLAEADRRLQELLTFNEDQHNKRQQIEILPLLALARQKQRRDDEALALLERAVSLAAVGASVGSFLESGQPLAELLRRLPPPMGQSDFVRGILEALDGSGAVLTPMSAPKGRDPSAPAGGALVEDLTDREQEILELLVERFQNKEIAGRLFISTHTVNDHLKGVYQKLNVHGRRQAVARARELGLLGAR